MLWIHKMHHSLQYQSFYSTCKYYFSKWSRSFTKCYQMRSNSTILKTRLLCHCSNSIQKYYHHIRIISKRFAVVKSVPVSTNWAVSISEPFCLVITQILTNRLPDPWELEKLTLTILHVFIIVGSGIWKNKKYLRYCSLIFL